MTTTDTTYEGYANYETWNVALWINNEYSLYLEAVDVAHTYAGPHYYAEFLARRGFADLKTPDGVAWSDPTLDTATLDALIADMHDH